MEKSDSEMGMKNLSGRLLSLLVFVSARNAPAGYATSSLQLNTILQHAFGRQDTCDAGIIFDRTAQRSGKGFKTSFNNVVGIPALGHIKM